MRESRSTLNHRTMAGPVMGLLLAMCTASVQAQPAVQSRAGVFGYDKAHEITLNGTVKSLVPRNVSGGPAGLHLILTTSQGAVDAHVGPYLTKDVQKQLTAGTAVQIIGAKETVHGKSYLLVRQLIFGGRLINVRTANGILTPAEANRPGHARSQRSESNGGAR
jgi:hypothetical protein